MSINNSRCEVLLLNLTSDEGSLMFGTRVLVSGVFEMLQTRTSHTISNVGEVSNNMVCIDCIPTEALWFLLNQVSQQS